MSHRSRIWGKILHNAGDLFPDFNDDLLIKFKERSMNAMADYLDFLFRQTCENLKVATRSGQSLIKNDQFGNANVLEYITYEPLGPRETYEYLRDEVYNKKMFDVSKSTFKVYKYIFKFAGVEYYSYQHLPYMDNYAILAGDTKYYPMFSIVEKGGLNVVGESIIVKVTKAVIGFSREQQMGFQLLENSRVLKAHYLSAQLHQKRRRRGSKVKNPPILIYLLATVGYDKTMEILGLSEKIKFTYDEVEEAGWYHIRAYNKMFIKVHESIVSDMNFKRTIVGLLAIFDKNKKGLDIARVKTNVYYTETLGLWVSPSVNSKTLAYNNGIDHLNSNLTMIDDVASTQLKTIGIECQTLNDLLFYIMGNIDRLINTYNPVDLFSKRIGSLEYMMSPLVRRFNEGLFTHIHNNKQGLVADNVKRLVKLNDKYAKWMRNSQSFESEPTTYNDNWLLTTGAKRIRSVDNTEITSSKKSGRISSDIQRSHYSHIFVESWVKYPSSSPIKSGTINPYLEITADGVIITPPEAEQHKDIFDI